MEKKKILAPKVLAECQRLALNVNCPYSSLSLLSSFDFFTDMFSVKGAAQDLIVVSGLCFGIQFLSFVMPDSQKTHGVVLLSCHIQREISWKVMFNPS